MHRTMLMTLYIRSGNVELMTSKADSFLGIPSLL